jgi:MFS family permease
MPRPVLVAALGVLTVMLDSAVNIALPAISAAFHVPPTSIQAIVLTYVVAFSLALIPAGRLADRAGHARVFRAGLALTGVTHLLCGLAPAWPWLLGARVVQGFGAALVMGSAPALVTLATPAGRRGRALGWLGLAASGGAVVGPLAGGLLVGRLGWPIVYLGRLPLVVLGLALARGLSGAVVASAADRAPPTRAGSSSAGILAGVGDRRGFILANAAHLLANAGWFAIWLLVPYYLIDRRGFSAGLSGLLFAVGPLAQACATPLGGRLADRGLGRWLAPAALAVEAWGLWLTGRLDDGVGPVAIAVALGLAGFGSGLFVVANMHYVMGAVAADRQGVAGSVVSLMRTAGIVVGANVTTAVYSARLVAHADLGRDAAAAAAFADAFGIAAVIAAAAALLSLTPPRARRGGRAAPP